MRLFVWERFDEVRAAVFVLSLNLRQRLDLNVVDNVQTGPVYRFD